MTMTMTIILIIVIIIPFVDIGSNRSEEVSKGEVVLQRDCTALVDIDLEAMITHLVFVHLMRQFFGLYG